MTVLGSVLTDRKSELVLNRDLCSKTNNLSASAPTLETSPDFTSSLSLLFSLDKIMWCRSDRKSELVLNRDLCSKTNNLSASAPTLETSPDFTSSLSLLFSLDKIMWCRSADNFVVF